MSDQPSSQSPPRSAGSGSNDGEKTYERWSEWNAGEVRALVCLIIKGEHKNTKDPVEFAGKLNTALNPGKANTKNAAKLFARDIPVDEVSNMLARVLAKKGHAVDMCERNPVMVVTRKQVDAFMRSLDFDGSMAEWTLIGRKHDVALDRAKMKAKLEKEKDLAEGERQKKKQLMQEDMTYNEQRLLTVWGMGDTFWEGEYKYLWKDKKEEPRLLSNGFSRVRRLTPESNNGDNSSEPGEISPARTSKRPKPRNDSYAAPELHRLRPRDPSPFGARSPDWDAPRPTLDGAPPTPYLTTIGGGWVGGSAPAASTPIAGGYGSAYGGGWGAATPNLQQPPTAYGGFGGGFGGGGAATPNQPSAATPGYGGCAGAHGVGSSDFHSRENDGHK